jgi:hypothetical protein
MGIQTYSFLDLNGAIAHPLAGIGSFTFTGQGVGEVIIEMTEDRSAHDIAADGNVMISKVGGNNGTIQIKCQQTSPVHKFLLLAYNALIIAPPDQWAQAAAFLRNVTDGTSHIATGVSFTKIPPKSYQKQGQMITWMLMAGDIQNITV